MSSHLTLKRLRIVRGSEVCYDEAFHSGVNIIRGDNSSGKSTIADFIFYGLGGEFDRWKDGAVQCTAVSIEIQTQESTMTLRRSIGAKLEPMFVFYGNMEKSLLAGIDHWTKLNIRRTSNERELSLSQVLFRAIGIPEAPNAGSSNVTMHQVMRLFYADQQTPAGKLFRFESFDTRDIRQTVGQLLIGINGYEAYESQIKLRELKSEYVEKDRLYQAAVAALPHSEGLTSVAILTDRIEKSRQTLADLLREISNVDDFVGPDQTAKFISERSVLQKQIRRTARRLSAAEERSVTLAQEIAEVSQFLEYLREQFVTLSSADTLAEKIGSIDFRYCPSCLKPLEASGGAHCIVCHSPLDEDALKSKHFEVRLDIELQIKESEQLLEQKRAEFSNIQSGIRSLRHQYSIDLTQFSARYDVSNSPRESYLAERNKRIGRIEGEIGYLEELRVAVERIDELSRQRLILNEQIEIIESRLKRLASSATSRTRVALDLIGETACRLLKKDLRREDAFENPKTFTMDFGDDAMLVDGKMNFAESSNVVLKNTSLLSLFLAACYDSDFWHPRFILMDNIEDKGMEQSRSHNFQRLIVDESRKLKAPHQIIFTTSMLNPSLEDPLLTVGPKYTRENKTLAGISTSDAPPN